MFDGRPLFLSVIPKTLDYEDALVTESARAADEVRKILIQKMPHLADGRLVFEPDEAEEMHEGAVSMLKGNPSISVLTTYGDAEIATSRTSSENQTNTLATIEHNIYAQAGVSSQIFSATSNSSLSAALDNDLALMMYLGNKFSNFISNLITELFGNANITFKYKILPVSYYNYGDYLDSSIKLLSYGYSYLMPAAALGLSQTELCDLKEVENDVLKLGDKLKPLSTSYTQSAKQDKTDSSTDDEDEEELQEILSIPAPTDVGGRPEKKPLEKSDKTLQNENSQG